MSQFSIPIDLLNPGQVFACLGLMEATDIICGPCEGRFAYTGTETQTRFEIVTAGEPNPVTAVVAFLSNCKVVAVAPMNSGLTAAEWSIATECSCGRAFPAPIPDSPATLPARLRWHGFQIPIEHWMDGGHCGRDNVKFWAGSGGYPGCALAQDAISCLSGIDSQDSGLAVRDPFSYSAPMGSSFRFDWRRDYIPLNVGFSPNNHKSEMVMVGYPIVELLAAIGLQNARPMRVTRTDKLDYRYHVSNLLLPLSLARAMLGADGLGIQKRTFRIQLGWPGKKDQARCIINAEEEFL